AYVVEATANQKWIAAAPAVVAFTSTFWRNAWKYRARAYRHCFWDSGTLLANLLAIAAARGLEASVVLGFVDDLMNRLLDLRAGGEVARGMVALARREDGSQSPPPAPALRPLGYETLPLSQREIDYPAIREMHAASCLTSPEEVIAWRQAAGAV